MRTYLIGFMGAGKSTLGRAAARLLGWPFDDLDELVEREAGMKVQQLFEREGEAAFRQREAEALAAYARAEGPRILACGGGTPCFGDNLARMKASGQVFYLRLPPGLLAQRLSTQRSERPLIRDLSEAELPAFIARRLAEREAWYLQAHEILEGPGLTARQLAERIRARWEV
jgi:shikimate kinase